MITLNDLIWKNKEELEKLIKNNNVVESYATINDCDVMDLHCIGGGGTGSWVAGIGGTDC